MKARVRYNQLSTARSEFLDTAVECSELTLPYLIRDDTNTKQNFKRLPSPWQAVGAKAVVTLAAKLKLHRDRLQDILNHLQETFPPKPIHPKMSSEEIMYHAGQANVVEYLQTLIEEE